MTSLANFDDKIVVSGSSRGEIIIYELEIKKLVKLNNGLNSPIHSLVQLIEKRMASSSDEGTIHIWDILNFKLIHKLDGFKSRVNSLVLLADETLAAAYSDHSIRLWDTSNGKIMKTLNGHNDSITSMVLLNDGNLLSASKDNVTIEWVQSKRYDSLKVHPNFSYQSFNTVKSAEECWQKCDSDTKCRISSFRGPFYKIQTCYLFTGVDYSLDLVYGWTSYAVKKLDTRNLTSCIGI